MIERIELEQTDEIAVSLPRPYIFPRCFDYLKITWTSLSCPVQNLEFKMRVFAVPEASNFEQSYYMEEYDIGKDFQAFSEIEIDAKFLWNNPFLASLFRLHRQSGRIHASSGNETNPGPTGLLQALATPNSHEFHQKRNGSLQTPCLKHFRE